MKKWFILVLFVVLFCNFAYAGNLEIYSAECFKDGHAEITIKSNVDERILTEDIELSADYITWYGLKEDHISLVGEWEDDQEYLKSDINRQKEMGVFITDEALFKNIGDHIINLKYPLEDGFGYDSFQFSCIGMIFSCTLINVEVEECKTTDNKKFEAVLNIRGINQSELGKLDLYKDVEYSLKAKNNYEDIKGEFSSTGSLPKGFDMVEKDGKQYVSYEFEDNFVHSFVAKFNGLAQCRDTKKYPNLIFYSYKECDFFETKEEVEPVVEEPEKEVEPVVEEIIEDKSENESNWLIGLLIGTIVFLVVVLIVVLKKQKTNKWWMK